MTPVRDRFYDTVYRNIGLTVHTHVAFSYWLGKLEMHPKLGGPPASPNFRMALFDAGNMDRDGNILKKGTRTWWYKWVIPVAASHPID
jgi:alpha-ketoglutarate-dependent 2,4-dichlorophenoxyacetate dioxygenase